MEDLRDKIHDRLMKELGFELRNEHIDVATTFVMQEIERHQPQTKETFMKAAEVEANELFPDNGETAWWKTESYRSLFIKGAQWAFEQLKKD